MGQRLILLDSLKRGRARWKGARLPAYVIQSHVDCFCGPRAADDTILPRGLLTVRYGAVVARATAINGEYSAELYWTVDSLFDRVERDLRGGTEHDLASIVGRPTIAEEFVRKATRLDLHPQYGFPIRYGAETPEIPDIWIDIRVDTFAVLARPTPRSRSRP